MDLCIDGGGSKTRVIGRTPEDASPLEEVFGPSNFRVAGRDGIQELADQIIEKFGPLGRSRPRVLGGFAGAGHEDACHAIKEAFINAGADPQSIEIMSDIRLTLRALNDNGTVLICGTGAICANLNSGHFIRAGGRGYLLPDGSGASTGRQAVSAYLDFFEGSGPATPLIAIINDRFCISSPDQLISKIYGEAEPRIDLLASLARDVLSCASTGDEVSEKIIRKAADKLARMTKSVLKRADARRSLISLMGGIFNHPDADALLVWPLRMRLCDSGFAVDTVRLGVDTGDPLIMALENTFQGPG